MPGLRASHAAHWAPHQYHKNTDAERNAAYGSDDVHLGVLVSVLSHHPEWSRRQFADKFKEVIRGFSAGGWGEYVLTDEQISALRDTHVDFELAWRTISADTVIAYGV